MNLINKHNSLLDSPVVSENWKLMKENDRIGQIKKFLLQNINDIEYEVIKAADDGQVIIRINQSIPASKRGLVLLEIEEKMKKNLDKGLTLWLEPIGDKSKLRNLRGISIKT